MNPDYEPRLFDADGDITKRWYIDYRIWDTDKNAFVRKQYTGMNKYRTLKDRRRVCREKLAELKELLAAGYTAGKTPALDLGINMTTATVQEAVTFVHSTKGLGSRGQESYATLLRRLKEFPQLAGMPVRVVQPLNVLAFLQHHAKRGMLKNHAKEGRTIGAKSYNALRDTLSSVFNYLIKLDLVSKNPVKGLERRRVEASERHRPYTEEQRQLIQQAVLASGDQQLLLFIQFIYYSFIRSGGELRLLQIKDIRADSVRVPSERSKNDKAEHVAIVPQLARLIDQHRLRDYPSDFYVFTRHGKPGAEPVGKNFFARRHGAILEAVGLTDPEYTVYGYKHTGAINLYLKTRDIEVVRRHCRHAHAGITANYLRGLGVMMDADALNQMPDF